MRTVGASALLVSAFAVVACSRAEPPPETSDDDDVALPADDDDIASDDDDAKNRGDCPCPWDDDDDAFGEDPSEGAPPPGSNVLLIVVDDFGLDAASFDAADPCYAVGSVDDDAAMPTLARLCREGVRFHNAWAMPTGAPTRASILTGLYPFEHGVGGPIVGGGEGNELDPSIPSIPALLAAHAPEYATAHVGKWDVSQGADHPGVVGWQHRAGAIGPELPGYSSWTRVVNGASNPETRYATTATVDDGLAWIESLTPDTPWLLWMAFHAPRAPFHKPPGHLHDYDDLPETQNATERQAEYARAALQALDTELGRLFGRLRESGAYEDTVIVFVADNGSAPEVVGAPFRPATAKGTLHEGGLAVPLIIAGAVPRPGSAVSAPVSVRDLFSTVLAVAGVNTYTVRTRSTSRSLWPLVIGHTDATPYRLASGFGGQGGESRPAGHALRLGSHKLICWVDPAAGADLFDLSVDRWAGTDLYGSVPGLGYEAVYAALAVELEAATGVEVCP